MALLSLVTAFLVVAAPVQKAETVGYYISELPFGESDLTSACYLFQGLPGVMGTRFGYALRSQLDCEHHLALTLSKKSPGDGIGIPDTLRFLVKRLYYDGKATVLVLRKEERATYANVLRTQLAKPGVSDMDSDLARAMLCYLALPKKAEGKFKHGVVSENVRSVLKEVKLADRVEKQFERISIVR